jgi:hypothetical protein
VFLEFIFLELGCRERMTLDLLALDWRGEEVDGMLVEERIEEAE